MITKARLGEIRLWCEETIAEKDGRTHFGPRPTEVVALLDMVAAAQAPRVPPHPTLQADIDRVTKWAGEPALSFDSFDVDNSIRLVLAELHSLRAVLADKIEESCAAEHIRKEARKAAMRDVVAWLWYRNDAHGGSNDIVMAIQNLEGGQVDQAAARGDLEPYRKRAETIACETRERSGNTVADKRRLF